MSTPYYSKFETEEKLLNVVVGSTPIGNPNGTLPSTGNIHSIGAGAGTYSNWGGMVIPENNLGTLRRINGEYSVSLTEITGLDSKADITYVDESVAIQKPFFTGQNTATYDNFFNFLICIEPSPNVSGKVKTLNFRTYSGTPYNIQFGIVEPFSGQMRIKSLVDITVNAAIIDVESLGLRLNVGDRYCVKGDNIGNLKYSSGVRSSYTFYDFRGIATPVIGSVTTFSEPATLGLDMKVEITEFLPLADVVDEIISPIINKPVNLMLFGSSLTEGYNTISGLSWAERINDMVDVNIINMAVSGSSINDNSAILISNTNPFYVPSIVPRAMKPKYILLNNTANGTPTGEDLQINLKNFKEIVDSYGAKLLLAGEEDYANLSKDYQNGYSAFATENNIPFLAITRLWRKLYPTTNPYNGFMFEGATFGGGGHSGWRCMAAYFKYFEMISKIPIESSVKMFRIRPSYKSGSPTITDLTYDTNLDRLKYFTAISNSRSLIDNTGKLDNGDNSAYNVSGSSINFVSNYQGAACKVVNKEAVGFNNYALVELILPVVNITKFDFKINSSVSPDNVYLARTNNSSLAINITRTFYEEVSFTYADGVVNVSLVDKVGIQLYDKVRIVIKKAGAFNLYNPILENYDGVKKVNSNFNYSDRKFGTELMPDTSFEDEDFTLANTAEYKSFPSQIANYTSYNASVKHLQLNADGDTATKTITVPAGCSKIAIRVVAQNFYKIATSRYVGTGIENSEYINDAQSDEVNYSFDYGILKLKINDNIIRKSIVWQGWQELYFEVDLDPSDTSIKIELGRNSLVDSSFNNHLQPILIHDVSIQKLS